MTDDTIFANALEQADPAARAAYLAEACAGDPERRRRVEGLLAAHEKARDFLEKPLVAVADLGLMPTRNLQGGETDPGESEDALTFLAPATRPDALGRLGGYEVLQVLGQGGSGIVLRVFDDVLQRVVAVKVLAPRLALTSPARKRFLREARASASVRHENVVQVHAIGEQPLPYLVMEYIPGETLQQRLDRTGPLDTAEVVTIGRQIAEGLAAAHAQGLIHRDIKPGNILIEAGPSERVKITDFGLARAADDASLTQSGVVAGTPLFMAPEQARGDALDHRADLFSLGSVLYTMCSGRPPFRANNTLAVLKRVAEDTPRPIPEIIPEVPRWLCDLISKLHAKKPEDRFASAREVADLLARSLADPHSPGYALPGSAFAPRWEKQPEPAPRSRGFRWATAAVLLMLLATFGITEATGVTKVRGTVIRFFSPEGTLVVEVDDPEVSVQVDGEDLVIKGAGAREIRLKPGKYTVEARKDGKVVSRELVTVTKDGRRVVRVILEAPPVTEAKDPDRAAAEYVLSIGGQVRVNEEGGDRNVAADLPRESFRLTAVHIVRNKHVKDAGLARFKDCKHLTSLTLHHMPVSDAGLAHLKGCKNLTRVRLAGTDVSDAGLAHFKDCKHLVDLNLAHTQKVNGAGLAHLKDCKKLTQLWLNETQVSDAGLAHIKALENLTWLTLHYSEQLSDAGLAHLKGCKNLTFLDLRRTKVTAAAIDDLKKALPMCQINWDGGVIDPN